MRRLAWQQARTTDVFPELFLFDRVKALAPQHPEWKSKEPFASGLKGDMKGVASAGANGPRNARRHALGHDHGGVRKSSCDRIATAKDPKTGRLYTEMVYQPMLEMTAYLERMASDLYVFGGGIKFMRPWTEKVYGIPPEQVGGSSGNQV